MKKIILVIILASGFGLVHAQELVSKKGTPILPEAKDWSIGFDAKPIFNYFGNMFNNSTNDSLYAGFQQPPFIIVGKYFIDANTAYRAMFRIGYSTITDDAFIIDENSTVSPPALVTDSRVTNETNIALGFGKQKYRGKGRVKGYYGYEGQFALATRKQTFEYGNQLNATNSDASLISTNFGAVLGDSSLGNNIDGQNRVTEAKLGTAFGIGVRGYLGIEYFFAAKFSIGAEYGWGINLITQGEGELTEQGFNVANSSVVTATAKSGKHSMFVFDTDNVGGGIFLSAYF